MTLSPAACLSAGAAISGYDYDRIVEAASISPPARSDHVFQVLVPLGWSRQDGEPVDLTPAQLALLAVFEGPQATSLQLQSMLVPMDILAGELLHHLLTSMEWEPLAGSPAGPGGAHALARLEIRGAAFLARIGLYLAGDAAYVVQGIISEEVVDGVAPIFDIAARSLQFNDPPAQTAEKQVA